MNSNEAQLFSTTMFELQKEIAAMRTEREDCGRQQQQKQGDENNFRGRSRSLAHFRRKSPYRGTCEMF